ncbi:hypothetical protein CFC21_044240 [Triticum aestivum]|uniref:TF-B3 domain-containing protein n=2 Tax=Triticum aestivum TaxID=4565 RepID=A0A9R1JXC9_WHEAT|nr:B3 domain-containing protein Os03g0619600-like isoform X2 [Triticum aestivum]KAF7033114.1 hypothetical protein CFC21_044240 [Triticum aestivum]
MEELEFFMILLPNFLKKLRLPDKFTKLLDGREPREVKLREAGCRRRLWDVEVVSDTDGHMYLGNGWEQFARAHDMRLGHFLVLSYDGHAVLTVKVFDGSMCRRHYHQDNDASSGSSSDCGNPLQGAEGEGEALSQTGAEEDDGEQCISKMSNPCDSDESQKERSHSAEELSEDTLSVDNSVESANPQTLSNNYVLSTQCYPTKAQRVKIDALIEKIKPKFTVLVVQMKKSNVKRHATLIIQKDYALEHFPCEDTTVMLQLPGKNKDWKCTLRIRPSGVSYPGQRNLYLRNFSCDNHVREGDICLFQPITSVKHRRFIVKVHILHKVSIDDKGLESGGCPKEGSSRCYKSANTPAVSYSTSKEFPDEAMELDDLQMLSKDYVLSGKCDLTVAQEEKINALVEKIRSEIPVLVVQMKKSSANKGATLVIQKDYALKYFPCEDTTIILQLPRKNKNWKCKFHIRASGMCNAGRRTLYLAKFVHDTHIREGDICLFQPMTNVKHRRFIVTAHLLHKESSAHSPGGTTGIGSNRGSTSAKMGGVKDEPPTDGEEYSSEHEEHEVSEDSEGAFEHLFMLSNGASLTPAQNLKCLEKVEGIKFKPPFYVAIMSKSTVCQRGSQRCPSLHFGCQYAATYLVQKFSADLHREENSRISLVLQREGKSRSWPTKLQYKYRTRGTSNQMTVHHGWPSFARDNHLRDGDICLFKLMDNEEQLSMMVYIVRR